MYSGGVMNSNTSNTSNTSNATTSGYTLVYGMKDGPSVNDQVNVYTEFMPILNYCASRLAHWERQGKRIVHATVLDTATGAVVTKLR
jgi:hypothetical protein